MKNTKIKQRKCPLGKAGVCVDYGNCGDCTWCKVIEKYEKKIKALQDKNANLVATAETEESHKRNLQTYIDNHEEIWKRNTEIAEKVARKEVAKEIYKKVEEFYNSPEYDHKDAYDCNALDAYNSVKEFIKRNYGIEA